MLESLKAEVACCALEADSVSISPVISACVTR